MLMMKKDMGGAATVLALAHMIMDAQAQGSAARAHPGGREFDFRRRPSGRATSIARARGSRSRSATPTPKGRLILADALALADEEAPELIVDMATLTGAARVALGPELPPFYTDDDALAAELARCAASGERSALAAAAVAALRRAARIRKSRTSTTCRAAASRGSITAALFLRRFVSAAKAWLHFDIYAWNQTSQARPAGRRRMPGRARALCAAASRATADAMPARSAPDAGARRSRGEALEGKVDAARFVEGSVREVVEPQAPLRREPRPTRRSTPKRSRASASPSTRERGRLGLGPARRRRLRRLAAGERAARRPVRRRRTRSQRCARWCFPGPRSSCRRSRRCRSAPAGDRAHRRALRGDADRAAIVPAAHLAPIDV